MTGSIEGDAGAGGVSRRPVDALTSMDASRSWWDTEADGYLAEHEGFLGRSRWVWGPEGWDESELGLLGPVAGRRVLELGCGAASGARWLAAQGARAVGLDLSHRMLQHSRRLDDATSTRIPVVQAHAGALPFREAVFDVVASSYGALPFVADADRVLAEVARVLVPGGTAVLAVTHPIRWAFRDDPGSGGLTAVRSYFDRNPYVEADDDGEVTYVEHHRTVGDWVDLVVGAGMHLVRLLEPPWKPGNHQVWDGWSPLRGALLPGTLVMVATR